MRFFFNKLITAEEFDAILSSRALLVCGCVYTLPCVTVNCIFTSFLTAKIWFNTVVLTYGSRPPCVCVSQVPFIVVTYQISYISDTYIMIYNKDQQNKFYFLGSLQH